MSRRKVSFLRGAAILAGAYFATRLLGALYWPVLTRVFSPFDGHQGEAGVGLARVPLPSYQLLLSFSSAGFNIAVSKLIAERLAQGDGAGAQRIFRVALTMMVILGVALTAGFWWGAPALARFSGDADAVVGFQAMAPAMLFMTLTAAYRGLFQGYQRMEPVGVSQLLEQLIRIAVGVALAAWWVRSSLIGAVAGVNLAESLGALVAAIYLYGVARRLPGLAGDESALPAPPVPPESPPPALVDRPGKAAGGFWPVARQLMRLALPISLIGAIVPLMLQTDTVLVYHLLRAQGLAEGAVREAYGELANSVQLVWLPSMLTQALYVTLVPAISEAMAQSDRTVGLERTRAALRLTLLIALPAAAGIWVLAEPLYRLVYGSIGGGPVLAALAWGGLFLMVQQTTAGALQGIGHVARSAWHLAAGALVKASLSYFLLAYTPLGVRGAAYGTVAGFGVSAALNLALLYREMGPVLPGRQLLTGLLPATAGMTAVLGGLLWLSGGPQDGLLGSLWTLGLVALGAGVYGFAAVLFRGLGAADLAHIPRLGPPLVVRLRRWHLLP